MALHDFLKAASGFLSVVDDQVSALPSPETITLPQVETSEFVMPFNRIDQTFTHPERINDPRVPHIGLELIAIVEAWNEVTEKSVESAYELHQSHDAHVIPMKTRAPQAPGAAIAA